MKNYIKFLIFIIYVSCNNNYSETPTLDNSESKQLELEVLEFKEQKNSTLKTNNDTPNNKIIKKENKTDFEAKNDDSGTHKSKKIDNIEIIQDNIAKNNSKNDLTNENIPKTTKQIVTVEAPVETSLHSTESQIINTKFVHPEEKSYEPGLNVLLECENQKCRNLCWISKGFGIHSLEAIRDDYECKKCKRSQSDTNIIKKIIVFNSNCQYNVLCRTNKSDKMISNKVMDKKMHGPKKRIKKDIKGEKMKIYDLSNLIKLLPICYYAEILCTSILE